MNRDTDFPFWNKCLRTGWLCLLSASLVGGPLISTVGLLVPAAQAQTVPRSVRQAYTLLNRGLVDQAIAAFQRILRQTPQSLESQLGLAIAYRRAGRDADAFQAYERVLNIDPSNQLALTSLGFLGSFRPEWQERGITALTILLNLNPNDLEARAQRALLYGYQGRFGEAVADYNIVLQSNPTPDSILGAAQVYSYAGNYQQGLELFNRYRATGRSITGNAAIAYALALRETGSPAQAAQILEAQLRQSTRLDNETEIQLRAALATAYSANRQFNEAATVLTPLRGREDARLSLARALNELGRYSGNPAYSQEAAVLYRQVLTATPTPTVALTREVADVLSAIPQEQAYALQLYQQLVQQQPNDRSLLVQQLVLANQLGLVTRTDLQQQLQAALPSLPSDPQQQRIIAQALTRIDSPDPGLLPLYQALVNTGVDEPLLNFRIAQILIQRNDLTAARTALAAYVATPTGAADQGANLLLLAEIDRREGNLEASAQRYQAILASNPTDSGVLEGAIQGLAGIRQSQGRVGEAIALYDQLIARNPLDLSRQLGRTSLAYQANLISAAEAEAVLYRWLQTRPLTDAPPELVSLVSALPPDPRRESLYTALLEVDPNNIPLQLRSIQVLAARNPTEARARVASLLAHDRTNLGAYFVQGQLAQDLGDLDLASETYEAILAQQPNNADALSALGGVRFQQRQFNSAVELYSQVLSIRPQDQVAQTSLIQLTAVQGRRLEALQQLEQLRMQQQIAGGAVNNDLSEQMQRLQEGFLQQRGIQPPWERY